MHSILRRAAAPGNKTREGTDAINDAATYGTVLVSLTDADGDFLNYSVDVVSLSLRKADGTIVQALPTHQRVDFARLVDLTELVTVAATVVA